jgi:hypothetical protein
MKRLLRFAASKLAKGVGFMKRRRQARTGRQPKFVGGSDERQSALACAATAEDTHIKECFVYPAIDELV